MTASAPCVLVVSNEAASCNGCRLVRLSPYFSNDSLRYGGTFLKSSSSIKLRCCRLCRHGECLFLLVICADCLSMNLDVTQHHVRDGRLFRFIGTSSSKSELKFCFSSSSILFRGMFSKSIIHHGIEFAERRSKLSLQSLERCTSSIQINGRGYSRRQLCLQTMI